MNTPICDFVKAYREGQTLRAHMPGHKGIPLIGPEPLDITEIVGADSLYEANGIIRESERNASALFGSADTFYSAEGSSLCIRAMLAMLARHAADQSLRPLILAARNVHKTFVSAVGMLDLPVEWLEPEDGSNLLSVTLTPERVEARIRELSPTALYLTSPDYLGRMADIATISEICHRHGVLLLVDNAHGAYLKFLPTSLHPLDLGADLVCDSAHKTLPALTGAAYLHVSHSAPKNMRYYAREALSLFGSTSPSYLILQSLDATNAYLADGYTAGLADAVERWDRAKAHLTRRGYRFFGDEPLKWTVCTKEYGYYGYEFADMLAKYGVVCEFADPDFAVLMLSADFTQADMGHLALAMEVIPKREPINEAPPPLHLPRRACSIREALLAPHICYPSSDAAGRVFADLNVSCPPAIPILICGELVDEQAITLFDYYGIALCNTVDNRRR